MPHKLVMIQDFHNLLLRVNNLVFYYYQPHLICHVFPGLVTGQKPNCKLNVDANSGHAFGILLAAVGALRPSGSGAS